MKTRYLQLLSMAVAIAMIDVATAGQPKFNFSWETVVNNNDLMPPLEVRNFNSYNQPSVNRDGLVVIRARSRGGPPLGRYSPVTARA